MHYSESNDIIQTNGFNLDQSRGGSIVNNTDEIIEE